MSELSSRIAILIRNHLHGDLTVEEKAELGNWLKSSEKNKLLFDRLTQEDTLREELHEYTEAGHNIWHKINKGIMEGKVVQLPQRKPWKYIAAAVAAIVIISGIFLWTDHEPSKSVAQHSPVSLPLTLNDIKPGGDKATLTLSNGSTMLLDSIQSGMLAAEKGASVVKLKDGEIIYRQSAEPNYPENISYNTISTPRGGRYHVVLSDGTGVWLNAASSISYPVVFTQNERTVSITGEAYFEVTARTASRDGEKIPFKVKIISPTGKETGEVEVLGTHFNINAYDDEATIKTTLLEGKVKVYVPSTRQSQLLNPGQQIEINNTKLSLVANPDIEEVMSWKNGLFQFKSAGIETIMRQVSRWYDIDVVYTKKPMDKFTGKINREVNLEGLLKILQNSGVKFTLEEGRKLVITVIN